MSQCWGVVYVLQCMLQLPPLCSSSAVPWHPVMACHAVVFTNVKIQKEQLNVHMCHNVSRHNVYVGNCLYATRFSWASVGRSVGLAAKFCGLVETGVRSFSFRVEWEAMGAHGHGNLAGLVLGLSLQR